MVFVSTLNWQQKLFADRLNRFELLRLRADWPCVTLTLRIHRNHGVEQVASALPPFLGFSGYSANILMGEYDDSLAFPAGEADIELVWLDYDRYEQLSDEDFCGWLERRLSTLRVKSKGAIIVANEPGDRRRANVINEAVAKWVATTPRAYVLDLAQIAFDLGGAAFDLRRQSLTGTKLSDAACLDTARELGLRVVPHLLAPGLKAVAVDLDNTIYQGVLSEDGIDGVVLTPGHKALQEKLVSLHEQGLLLVVISKNETVDVHELFATRDDFPLRPAHISDWQVSWRDKSKGVAEAAKRLRIAVDAFLVVDDNLGELTSVGTVLPTTRLIYAGASPEETLAALEFYPGLAQGTISITDTLRSADLRANEEREALATTVADPVDYLRSLGVEIELVMNPAAERKRLAEMCRKTNQFNLAIARLDELKVASYLTETDRRAVLIFMKDRLADSGSVASLFFRRKDDVLVVDELCVSCRAMGRRLEDIMIVAALEGALDVLPASIVRFVHSIGPRNQPARTWLSSFTGLALGDEGGVVDMAWDRARYREMLTSTPVALIWRAPHDA